MMQGTTSLKKKRNRNLSPQSIYMNLFPHACYMFGQFFYWWNYMCTVVWWTVHISNETPGCLSSFSFIHLFSILHILCCTLFSGARGVAVDWGTALQAGRSRVLMVSLEFFHWHNPSGRTMALGLTQPLTEMSTRNISWGGKGDRCVGLTTLPPSCAECLEIWEPQPPGTLRACPGL